MARIRAYLLQRKALMETYYSVAVPLGSFVAVAALALGAVAQRRELFPPGLSLLWAALLFVPLGLTLALANGVGWPKVNTVALLVGTLLLLSVPVETSVLPFIPDDADAVAVALPMMVGVVAAVASFVEGALTAAGGLVVLTIAAASGWLPNATLTPLYFAAVPFGWLCGLALRSQQRLLERERDAQAAAAERAAEQERGRIAREIHDVVAHSLAVTMLHLTGARRTLQVDGNVPDAVDALTDAERVGRQAMTDIRRTVGLLAATDSSQVDSPNGSRPEPDAGDVDALVADYRRAGLDVAYTVDGDLGRVTAGTGLALYRVVQESLANVVKHAAGSSATVAFTFEGSVDLVVSNTPPAAPPPYRAGGRGLVGMRQRIEVLGGTLDAGPAADGGWSVRASVPMMQESGRRT